MRAARIHEYGPPEKLVVEEAPVPEVGPRDVLIEVYASSVNPIDWKIRKGDQRSLIRYKLPHVLGLDVSGVVLEVGEKVVRYKKGDEVYASPSHSRSGTYAEKVSVDQKMVAKKPKNITHEEAAGIPLAGLTAWQALVRAPRFGLKGKRVLIHAGSGGVGTLAIQIAKMHGAEVITTCSAKNEELVRDLGADRVIDYREERFEDEVSDVDIVVDALGYESMARSLTVMRRGGQLSGLVTPFPDAAKKYGINLGPIMAIFTIVWFLLRARFGRGIRVSNILRPSDGKMLERLTRAIEAGKIRPVVDKVFPLDEIAEAHRYCETGRARGKVIVSIKPSS